MGKQIRKAKRIRKSRKEARQIGHGTSIFDFIQKFIEIVKEYGF